MKKDFTYSKDNNDDLKDMFCKLLSTIILVKNNTIKFHKNC